MIYDESYRILWRCRSYGDRERKIAVDGIGNARNFT